MQYQVIDIINKELTNNELQDLINKKLYKIIEFMELDFNDNN